MVLLMALQDIPYNWKFFFEVENLQLQGKPLFAIDVSVVDLSCKHKRIYPGIALWLAESRECYHLQQFPL